MVEGRNQPRVRQQRRCLLRGRTLLDVQGKGALLVEAERVHAVDNDLACQLRSQP